MVSAVLGSGQEARDLWLKDLQVDKTVRGQPRTALVGGLISPQHRADLADQVTRDLDGKVQFLGRIG